MDEILKCDHSNIKGYFLLVLFIMVYKVDRSLESVDKIGDAQSASQRGMRGRRARHSG